GGTTPAVVSAEITFADEKSFPRAFYGIAEAVPDQIPSLRPSALEVASTRAKARALRDALNLDVAILEDADEEDAPDGLPAEGPPAPPQPASTMAACSAERATAAPAPPAEASLVRPGPPFNGGLFPCLTADMAD